MWGVAGWHWSGSEVPGGCDTPRRLPVGMTAGWVNGGGAIPGVARGSGDAMRPDGRLLVWRLGGLMGGALSQVLPVAAGMLCAPMAGGDMMTGPQRPAPSAHGWPPSAKAARSLDRWG